MKNRAVPRGAVLFFYACIQAGRAIFYEAKGIFFMGARKVRFFLA